MSTAPQEPAPSIAQAEPLNSVDVLADAVGQQELTAESNAHTVAYHLPPELLVEVFVFLQNVWWPERVIEPAYLPGEGNLSELLTYLPGWTTVLHVCAFWRKVALSAPVLWQEVDATAIHPDSVREVLARSAGLNLCLTLDDLHPLDIWLDKFVFCRIETLNYHWSEQEDQSLRLLSQTAPNIRQLILFCDYLAHLPAKLLGPVFPPSLRELSLTRCIVPAGFSLFAPALTHLKLYLVDLDESGSSVAQILSLLALFPALEYLHLDLYPVSETVEPPVQHISLPSLNYVSLKLSDDNASPTAITSLLQHLSIPHTTEMAINAEFGDETDETDCQDILSAVFPDNPGHEVHFQLVLISCNHWTVYQHDSDAQGRTGKRCVNMIFRLDTESLLDKLRDFIAFVHPRSLVVLDEMWRKILKHSWIRDEMDGMEHIRYLTVCCCGHEYLRSTLETHSMLFPRLDTIVVTDSHGWWPNKDMGENAIGFERASSSGVRKCMVDADLLSATAFSLTVIVQLLKSAAITLREVRVEGKLGGWDGWDTLRTSFGVIGDLNLVTTASTSN